MLHTGDPDYDGGALEEAELQAKSIANVIMNLKERLAALLMKDHMSGAEAKELEKMNRELLKHMEDFEAETNLIQTLVNFADQHMKPQKKQPIDMLPKVVICGITECNMPKIIICDADKKKPRPWSSRSAQCPQSKLANDNMNLEDKSTCTALQRKLCSLQSKVRVLTKENTTLNERLAKVQEVATRLKCRPRLDSPCGGGRAICPADVKYRLQYYSQTTNALEKQVEAMEDVVRQMQDELTVEQHERPEPETQREAAAQPPPQHVCRPTCYGPCHPIASVEQQLRKVRKMQDELTAEQHERPEPETQREAAAQPPPQHVCLPTCYGPCHSIASVEQQLREVRKTQDELTVVQHELPELDAQREAAAQPPPQHVCRPTCYGPCHSIASVEQQLREVRKMQDELTAEQAERTELETQREADAHPRHVRFPAADAEQQLRELREQYNRLQDDYEAKVTEVASLRSDNDKLKCTCQEATAARKMAEYKIQTKKKLCYFD